MYERPYSATKSTSAITSDSRHSTNTLATSEPGNPQTQHETGIAKDVNSNKKIPFANAGSHGNNHDLVSTVVRKNGPHLPSSICFLDCFATNNRFHAILSPKYHNIRTKCQHFDHHYLRILHISRQDSIASTPTVQAPHTCNLKSPARLLNLPILSEPAP